MAEEVNVDLTSRPLLTKYNCPHEVVSSMILISRSAGNSFSKRLCPVALRVVTQRGYDNGVTAGHRTARFAIQVARRFLRQPSSELDYRNQ